MPIRAVDPNEDERERQARVLTELRDAPGDLFGGTVAHIVRAYGDYRITVSERVPRGLHAAAAAHLMESHVRECYAPHCAVGRAFLPAPLPAAGVG